MTIKIIRWSRGFDLEQTVFIYVILLLLLLLLYTHAVVNEFKTFTFLVARAEVVRIYLITRTTLCL